MNKHLTHHMTYGKFCMDWWVVVIHGYNNLWRLKGNPANQRHWCLWWNSLPEEWLHARQLLLKWNTNMRNKFRPHGSPPQMITWVSGLLSLPVQAFVVCHEKHGHLVMNTIQLHVIWVVYYTLLKLLKGEMSQKKLLKKNSISWENYWFIVASNLLYLGNH